MARADEEERRQFELRECEPGRGHQRRAGDQHIAQVVARRDEADEQGHERSAEQRGCGDDADQRRIEADQREISGQDDDGEAIPEAA